MDLPGLVELAGVGELGVAGNGTVGCRLEEGQRRSRHQGLEPVVEMQLHQLDVVEGPTQARRELGERRRGLREVPARLRRVGPVVEADGEDLNNNGKLDPGEDVNGDGKLTDDEIFAPINTSDSAGGGSCDFVTSDFMATNEAGRQHRFPESAAGHHRCR